MKNVLFCLLLLVAFSSCESVKNNNNFDKQTYYCTEEISDGIYNRYYLLFGNPSISQVKDSSIHASVSGTGFITSVTIWDYSVDGDIIYLKLKHEDRSTYAKFQNDTIFLHSHKYVKR